jgi:hypothetical protein
MKKEIMSNSLRISIVLLFGLFIHVDLFAQDNGDSDDTTVASDTTGVASDTAKVEPPKYWSYSGNFNFNVAQVALNENWTGGGESNVALASTIDMKLNYKKGNSNWENSFFLEYGRARQGKKPNPFIKTTDNLIVITRYGYNLNDWLDIKFIGDFRTQVDEGLRFSTNDEGARISSLISDFMAPGFLLLNLGLSHSKVDKYSITLSPIATKTTFVLNDSLAAVGSFGNAAGQRINSEFGGSFIGSYQFKVMDNISFRTNLNLFANYTEMTSLRSIDVNWENVMTLTVNKYIKSTIATLLIWDEDIDVRIDEFGVPQKGVQFRSGITIGLAIALNKQF